MSKGSCRKEKFMCSLDIITKREGLSQPNLLQLMLKMEKANKKDIIQLKKIEPTIDLKVKKYHY